MKTLVHAIVLVFVLVHILCVNAAVVPVVLASLLPNELHQEFQMHSTHRYHSHRHLLKDNRSAQKVSFSKTTWPIKKVSFSFQRHLMILYF